MKGYDLSLVEKVRNNKLTDDHYRRFVRHITNLIDKFKIIGACAGSLFVFKGKYKAVLINYPTPEEKIKLLTKSN